MLIFVFFIILFVIFYQKRQQQNKLKLLELEAEKQKEILKATTSSEEREKKRIANELHDDVGALLSATRMFISNLTEDLENPEHKESASEINEMVNDSLERIRTISRDVSPTVLSKFGLNKALESLCGNLNKVSSTEILFRTSKNQVKIEDEFIEINIYRVFQEILNNTLKYSNATRISIEIAQKDGQTLFDIHDNGEKFNLEKAITDNQHVGLGLSNIEARLQNIEAEISYIHAKGYNMNRISLATENK